MEVDNTEEIPSPPSSQIVPEQQFINGDEDRYKPEGMVEFKIEKVSEFVKERLEARRLSDAVYIRGLPWKILAINRQQNDRGRMGASVRCLGYFLQCNGDSTDPAWSCHGSATLKILNHKGGEKDQTRKIRHLFHAKENDWGFAQFINFEELMNPEAGWWDEATDSIVLTAEVTADAPHGVNWDSKKDTGCIGLKNQGATCYMNSILQTLFFTNKLRKAIYQIPTEDDNPESSVAPALQRVFYELQFSDSPVGTKKLTKSFGWDSIDSFLQHDVQEFCRVLLDNLENKMKNTKVMETIPSLFKGRTKSYIKCKEVSFESSREECFYDLQINVKGKSNVLESFKDYIEPEILDGENKYDAGEFGLQPAEKGIKFLSFPPVLHLQLMRFQYDPQLDANVKVNDRFEFPPEMNLNEYVDTEEGVKDDYSYKLHAVLVHSGDFHSGHYVVFINTNIDEDKAKWCKFDDEVVCRVSDRQAITANFGGNDPEVLQRHSTSAYMLVYVRRNAINEALCDVTEDDIPEHLKTRFENEKKLEAQKKHEKEEAKEMCEIILITDEEMMSHHGYELFDQSIINECYQKRYKVFKSTKLSDLYSIVVGPKLGLDGNTFRLWEFSKHEEQQLGIKGYHFQQSDELGESNRPRIELPPDDAKTLDQEEWDQIILKRDSIKLIYVEMEKPSLEPSGNVTWILAFIKYYNREKQLTEFKGTLHLSTSKSLLAQMPLMNRLIGLPEETKLNLYLELPPARVLAIMQTDQPIEEDTKNFIDGMILIVERVEEANNSADDDSDQTVKKYFKKLYNQIEVEAHINLNGIGQSKLNTPTPPIRGQISLDWDMPKVCSWLAGEIGYDLDKILLWKVSQPSEKPIMYLSSAHYRQYNLRELLNLNNYYDPRQKRVYKMYYTKLPFDFLNLEERKHLHVQMLHDDFQITEISVFPKKHGTVGDVLEEAKNEFKYNPNGSGVLRLVFVYSSANISRVFHVLKEDESYSENLDRTSSSCYQFRVEEVPKDQLEIGPDEQLFPVAHFDKDPCRMFGVPFFIKISPRDSVNEIKKKVKQVLHVSEKEVEKYKFHIVVSNRIVRDLDEDEANLNEIFSEYLNIERKPALNVEPYLGLDHFNKMRGRVGLLEKPIIIHN